MKGRQNERAVRAKERADPPIDWKCPDCGARAFSRYARKSHVQTTGHGLFAKADVDGREPWAR